MNTSPRVTLPEKVDGRIWLPVNYIGIIQTQSNDDSDHVNIPSTSLPLVMQTLFVFTGCHFIFL